MWQTHTSCPVYTHYINNGASRFDRIYATKSLLDRKKGAETVAAAFSDHLAVIVHITFDTPRMLYKARMWRMNITLFEEPEFRGVIKEQWGKWQRFAHNYQNKLTRWDTYVKCKIRQVFQREGAVRNREITGLDNYFYEMMYRVLQDPIQTNKASHRKLKANITRLHIIQQRGILLDNDEIDRMTGEDPSLFHCLRSRERRERRMITHAVDENGHLKRISRTPCIFSRTM